MRTQPEPISTGGEVEGRVLNESLIPAGSGLRGTGGQEIRRAESRGQGDVPLPALSRRLSARRTEKSSSTTHTTGFSTNGTLGFELYESVGRDGMQRKSYVLQNQELRLTASRRGAPANMERAAPDVT